MNTLLAQERDLYTQVWASISEYGTYSPGQRSAGLFTEMVADEAGRLGRVPTVLDAGCGKGDGARALIGRGFHVIGCDLTDEALPVGTPIGFPFVKACLWDDLRPPLMMGVGRMEVDFVYCCDVLEHIPTALTMLVIERLQAIAERGVFLTISFMPDNFGVWVGQPLHKTIESFVWWRDLLATVGDLVEARDLCASGVFYLRGQRAQRG